MRARWSRTDAWRLVSGSVVLVLALVGGTPAALADHPAPGSAPPITLAIDVTSPAWDFPIAASWIPGAALVVGLVMRASAGWRRSRRLAVVLAFSLAVFAGETALHSAHHVTDPSQAERCPVYSASLHVTSLEAGLATPEFPLPAPTPHRAPAREGQWLVQVLDGSPARAPPVRSA